MEKVIFDQIHQFRGICNDVSSLRKEITMQRQRRMNSLLLEDGRENFGSLCAAVRCICDIENYFLYFDSLEKLFHPHLGNTGESYTQRSERIVKIYMLMYEFQQEHNVEEFFKEYADCEQRSKSLHQEFRKLECKIPVIQELEAQIKRFEDWKELVSQDISNAERLLRVCSESHPENDKVCIEIQNYIRILDDYLHVLESNEEKLKRCRERLIVNMSDIENDDTLSLFEFNEKDARQTEKEIQIEIERFDYHDFKIDWQKRLTSQVCELYTPLQNQLTQLIESTESYVVCMQSFHFYAASALYIFQQQLDALEESLTELNSFEEQLQNASNDSVNIEMLIEFEKKILAANSYLNDVKELLNLEKALVELQNEFRKKLDQLFTMQEQTEKILDEIKTLSEDEDSCRQVAFATAMCDDIISHKESLEALNTSLIETITDHTGTNILLSSFWSELSQKEITEIKICEDGARLNDFIIELRAKISLTDEVIGRANETNENENFNCELKKLKLIRKHIETLNSLSHEKETTEAELETVKRKKSNKKRIMIAVIISSPILVCITSAVFFKLQQLFHLALQAVIPLSTMCLIPMTIAVAFFLYQLHVNKAIQKKLTAIGNKLDVDQEKLDSVNRDTSVDEYLRIFGEQQAEF
jgi:hypothetical protein